MKLAFITGICIYACSLLICSTRCIAQSSECASIAVDANEILLSASSWDPVLAIGRTLADKYGISVSIEAPKWAFPIDAEDVAVADPEYSAKHNNIHYQVMRRHLVQVRVQGSKKSGPDNVAASLHQVADAANKEMPYAYRVDVNNGEYTLVPTKTRNSAGLTEEVQPLLDRHITIPEATRAISEHGRILAEQLSAQTGLHISCCQTFVAGVPWGMAKISFGADDKPAREVLNALIQLEQQTNTGGAIHPEYNHWEVSCDGTGAPWCLIDVAGRFSGRCR